MTEVRKSKPDGGHRQAVEIDFKTRETALCEGETTILRQ